MRLSTATDLPTLQPAALPTLQSADRPVNRKVQEAALNIGRNSPALLERSGEYSKDDKLYIDLGSAT